MNIIIFSTPLARKNKLPQIQEILGRENKLSLFETRKPGDLPFISQRIREGKYDIIVSPGGDGFLNEVLNGMLASGVSLPVGIIPLGSMNVFARSHGIPGNITEACRAILNKKTRKIDLGKIDNGRNSRFFLCWAGIGYDTHVIHLVNRNGWLKRKYGGLLAHFVIGVPGLFSYPGIELSIQAGNHTYHGCNLIVSNIKSYASSKIRFTETAEPDDGYLHACLFKGRKKSDILRYIAGIVTGRHKKLSDVTCFSCKELRITAKTPVPVHADAEELEMKLPGKIEILPAAVDIIVP